MTTGQLAGQVALVTGASSGIGAATARELASRGARVVLSARRQPELQAQVQAITQAGGQALALTTDASDPAAAVDLAQRAIAAYGQIDILVNNAGIGMRQLLAQTSPREIAQILQVNLLSTITLTHALLPAMLQRRHGSIIFVGSVSGHIATDPLYSATKFGLRGFSLSLRRQLAGSGVGVSLVSPGFIRTAMTQQMRGPLPGPQLVARTIAGLVSHPRRELIVPRFYIAAIWLERLAPWLADQIVRRAQPSSSARPDASP